LGDALAASGHEVDYAWREGPPSRWQSFSRFFEVPSRQLHQAQEAFGHAAYDVVVLHQPHGYPIFKKLAPLYPQCVFLNFSHGWELCVPDTSNAAPGPLRYLKNELATMLTRQHCDQAAALAHGVIVLNRLDANFLSRCNGLGPDRVCILPLGLDPALLASPARPPAPLNQPARFLYTGNYLPLKGSEVMEAALRELAREGLRFEFTCVTHADRHAGLRAGLGAALDGRLHLLGWQPRAELPELFRRQDFLLFPSLYEGFGKVAHEAMACGLSVIGSRVGVLADRAKHGENALLSPPGDTAAFLENLRRAVREPALANVLGPRARAAVVGDTWSHTAACFADFVNQCRARLGISAN
jgi:glycosyltransferase involved in cell wall biosynthesis